MLHIDFVAGHPLQAQGLRSVSAALQDRVECRWRFGRPVTPTGAAAVVLADHVHHHPDWANWPKRFYIPHDMGDVAVYQKERRVLRRFTTVIVPDATHAAFARQYVSRRWFRSGAAVWIGGWPKYDVAAHTAKDKALAGALKSLPHRPTILYAVSWAGEDEWQTLMPALKHLPVNIVIKNHPYATAAGEEASQYYLHSRRSAMAMEAWGSAHQCMVAPADLNVCALFPYVDAVISDQSSVLAEFLPWGVSLETGTNPDGAPRPEISRWYPGVTFWPLADLQEDLKSGGRRLLKYLARPRRSGIHDSHLGQGIADMIWREINRS